MARRLVSSFKLSFWQIKIRLFPDQGGCAKPLVMPAEIVWNEGKEILRSRPGHKCALAMDFYDSLLLCDTDCGKTAITRDCLVTQNTLTKKAKIF